MILKKGIFYGEEQMSESEFLKICKYVAGVNHGKVKQFKGIEYNNFYEAHLYVFKKDYWVRLNMSHPFIGIIDINPYILDESGVGWINTNPLYIDIKELAEQFAPYYQVLTANELNRLLETSRESNNPKKWIITQENELNENEHYWISDYMPKTIGEIIFNYWD